MEVSFTPGITNNSTDSFWQHYDDDEKSDSRCSEQDYFPTDDNTILCVHVLVMVHSSGSAGSPMFSLIYI